MLLVTFNINSELPCLSHLLLTAYDFCGNCNVLLLKKKNSQLDCNKCGSIFLHALVTVWNDLPLDIRKSSSISLFKNRLKIYTLF